MKKRSYLALTFVLITFISGCGGCNGCGKVTETNTSTPMEEIFTETAKKDTVSMKIDTNLTDTKVVETALSDRQVYYAGLEDCTINKDSAIYLENLPENEDFYMAYEVYVDDKLVHKTDLIPSRKFSKWIPGETMEPGTYVFNIKHIPYYEVSEGEFVPLAYQPVNPITVVIK